MRKPTVNVSAEALALILAAQCKQQEFKNSPHHFLRFRNFDNLRASILAYTYWCDFGALVKLQQPRKPDDESEETDATAIGTAFHKVLEESQGRRFPYEAEFMEQIEKYRKRDVGWTREFKGVSDCKFVISGHPDDFQVLPSRRVAHVEYKTTKTQYKADGTPKLEFIERFKLCMARFQVQIYTWIMEPIYAELGYYADAVHAVAYYDSGNFKHLKTYCVEYRSQNVEADLTRIVNIIKNPEFCIAPKKFKCKMCYPELKTKCPLWLQEHGQ